MSDFSDLLFEAEKLTQEIDGTAPLPKVDRSLRQVLEASNELYTRVAHSGAKDIQANLLLGSKGIDLPRISQKLDVISTKRTLETVEPIDDVDIEACLENELRNAVLGIIDEEHQLCYKNIMEESWEHKLGEWKQDKRKILNSMVAPSGDFMNITKLEHIFVESSNVGSQYMTQQEAIYAGRVLELNKMQLRFEAKPDLVSYFSKAAEEFKDTKVNDMWEIIKYMTLGSTISGGSDPMDVRKNKTFTMEMVNQGKKYLENRYKTYMKNVINENLAIAQRGGIPGTYPTVWSYVGIRLHGGYIGLMDGEVEGRPLWPMIYYCLRSGDINAALDCLKRSNFTQCFPELVSLLDAKFKNPKHPSIQKLEAAVRFQYRRQVRNETDPFKRIVWAVLGCCDIVDEHSEVAKTADDWLWLKLSLVRVDYENEEHLDYFDFQRTIIEEYGESHYDAMNQPHLYFQVLTLTGQFEAAIEFLSRTERYRTHAVHMAIALNDIYLLAGPKDYTSPLIFIDPADPKPARRLNIVRLILLYVRKFEMFCVEEALNYFFLLNNLHNDENVNMYIMCVSDLAQEIEDYEKIFGKMQRSGIRSKGLLDELRHSDITVEKIAQFVGEQLLKRGALEQAVELFDIANNTTEVLNILCSLLTQVVTLPSAEGSLRNRLFYKIREIDERYGAEGYQSPYTYNNTFTLLKDLLLFFDYYHTKNYNAAVKTLLDIKLIPVHEKEIEERINLFKTLNTEVCHVMPDLILAAMTIYYEEYQKLKSGEYTLNKFKEFSANKQTKIYKDYARVLTNFTGMLPYRMPGDINSRLIHMEIMMN